MDHNAQFVAAIKRVQQDSLLDENLRMYDIAVPILCWAHISRTALQSNKSKFSVPIRYDDFANHLEVLHFARSQSQFTLLSSKMIDYWRSLNESNLASWFQQEYMSDEYCRWSVTCSDIPGVTPNNNLLESFHKHIKISIGI
jgi:hypothetical protein